MRGHSDGMSRNERNVHPGQCRIHAKRVQTRPNPTYTPCTTCYGGRIRVTTRGVCAGGRSRTRSRGADRHTSPTTGNRQVYAQQIHPYRACSARGNDTIRNTAQGTGHGQTPMRSPATTMIHRYRYRCTDGGGQSIDRDKASIVDRLQAVQSRLPWCVHAPRRIRPVYAVSVYGQCIGMYAG